MIRKLLNELLSRLRGQPSVDRLRRQGLAVGDNVNIRPRVSIDFTYACLISIGNDVTLSEGSHVLAHDASMGAAAGVTKVGMVRIEDEVFIGRGAIVLPGVSIGRGAVVAANAVVAADVPAHTLVAGVPARQVATTDAWADRHSERAQKRGVLPWELQTALIAADRGAQNRIRQAVADGPSYIAAHEGFRS